MAWLCACFVWQNDSTDYDTAYSSGGAASGGTDYESLWEGDGNTLEMDENELRISWNSGFFTRSRNVISLSLDHIVRPPFLTNPSMHPSARAPMYPS